MPRVTNVPIQVFLLLPDGLTSSTAFFKGLRRPRKSFGGS